jgi:hypothetical protein
MDLRPLQNPAKPESELEQKQEELPVIESPIKVNASSVELEISNEKEEEEPIFDIRIVDKPRTELIDEMAEEKKTKPTIVKHEKEEKPSQFTLFESSPAKKEEMHITQDMMAEQDLERDQIKKRISIEMQKHQISLHELEKEPAYKRYGYSLEDGHVSSEKSNFSNYTIYSNSEDPGKIEIRQNPMKDITLD